MNFCKNLIGAILLLFLGACSTSKEVAYFQDLRPGESELALTAPVEIKIQPKDKLSILVNSQDLRLTNLFNLPIVSPQIGMEGSSGSNRGVSGYTVDSKGNIDFPVLGEIHIAGMTREEVATYIKKELQSHDLIKDPVVTVEYMNLSIAVMGEVNNPGRFSIDKDPYNPGCLKPGGRPHYLRKAGKGISVASRRRKTTGLWSQSLLCRASLYFACLLSATE